MRCCSSDCRPVLRAGVGLNVSNGLGRCSVPITGADGGVEKSIRRLAGFCGLRAGVFLRVSSKVGIVWRGETGIAGLRIDFRGAATVD